MNRNPDTRGLKSGNTTNVGRKPSVVTLRREQTLAMMRDFPSASDSGGTLLDDAFQALSELIAQRDGPTVRWFIDQQIGTPKTVQELILPPSDFIVAVATVVHDVIAVELGRADLYEDFASRMQEAVESLPS